MDERMNQRVWGEPARAGRHGHIPEESGSRIPAGVGAREGIRRRCLHGSIPRTTGLVSENTYGRHLLGQCRAFKWVGQFPRLILSRAGVRPARDKINLGKRLLAGSGFSTHDTYTCGPPCPSHGRPHLGRLPARRTRHPLRRHRTAAGRPAGLATDHPHQPANRSAAPPIHWFTKTINILSCGSLFPYSIH